MCSILAECYCGNTFSGTVVQRPEAECNMPCNGNSSMICGGAARMSVYSKDMRSLKRDVALGIIGVYEERDLSHEERELAPVIDVRTPTAENDTPLQEREPTVAKRNVSNIVRSPSAGYRHGAARRTIHGRSRLSPE
jgi:hypothetical protein